MAVIILIYDLELTYDDYQLWAELLSSLLIYPFTRKIKILLVILLNECYKFLMIFFRRNCYWIN